MWYESQGPTELGVLPRGIESIVVDDLCFPSDFALIGEHPVPAELFQAGAAVAVEQMDYGGADEESVAEGIREIRPELAAEYGESTLREVASRRQLPGEVPAIELINSLSKSGERT